MGGSDALVQKETTFPQHGCVACHGPQREDQEDSLYISLKHLASKTTVDALSDFLQNPSLSRPSGRMPHLRLDAKEARALSVFLLRDQLHKPQSLAADPGEEPGLGFAYYEIDGLNALPNFEDLTAHTEGSTDQITLNLPVSKRNNNYAIRYVGQLHAPTGSTPSSAFQTMDPHCD